jgi:hypothetical protein
LSPIDKTAYITVDLNMGDYTIRLDPTAAKMYTIIFLWGKYSYQRLTMGFARLADIFQAEIGNLMATLEYIRAYIDNPLVITKGSLDDHLDKLKQVFIRLHDAGLKINAAKLFFCAQETEYLGYILTRGGIKPQPKKVQAILTLNPPNNVKKLPQFLGMVQYYWDGWQKHSEMLVPLTDLVGECGETNTTKKNKTKKKPWWCESIHQQALDNLKATIAKEVVLAYPDFTKPFEISSSLGNKTVAGSDRSCISSASLGYKSFNCSMYHIPVPTLIERFV